MSALNTNGDGDIMVNEVTSSRSDYEISSCQTVDELCEVFEEKLKLRRMVAKLEMELAEYKKDVVKLRKDLQRAKKQHNERNILLARNAKVGKYIDKKIAQMYYFLEKYFPSPNKSNQVPKRLRLVSYLTMTDLIEKLFMRLESDPEEPYIDIDETIYPPYLKMLLRFNIAKCKPDDSTKMCLVCDQTSKI